MRTKLSGFLGIISVVMLFAWTPAASAATWSSTVCNPPPTYGPYIISGSKKYYCPAAGSFVPTTSLGGAWASDIMNCTADNPCPTPTVITDKIQLGGDAGAGPNVAIQCKVPGSTTCKGKQCGGSPDSSGPVFLNQVFFSEISSPVTSESCVREKGSGAIKCTKTNYFKGLEEDAAAAALYCPNAEWQITKWLALKLYTYNAVKTADGEFGTFHYCELVDPQGNLPGSPGYSPDLNTPSNNSYACTDINALPPLPQ